MKKIFLVLAMVSVQLLLSQKRGVSEAEAKKESAGSNTKAALQLSKEEIALYNGKFLKFINALKASDRKGMEALLSEKALKMVTETVYEKLARDIKTDKAFEIVTSGFKPLIDGSSRPVIRYKYADDKSAEPREIITAVFEKDGKILGIKPYKMTK